MTDLNGSTPPPITLEAAAEAYGKALIASMTNGTQVSFDAMQLVIEASMALRLGEFVAEKLAPLLGQSVGELKAEFGANLMALTALMPKPSGIAIAYTAAREDRRKP